MDLTVKNMWISQISSGGLTSTTTSFFGGKKICLGSGLVGSFKGRKKTYCSTKMESGPTALALISLKWQVRVGKFAANPRSGCEIRCSQIQNLMIPSLLSFRMQESRAV